MFLFPIILLAQKNAFTVIIGDKSTCNGPNQTYSIQTPYQIPYTWVIIPSSAGTIVQNYNTSI